MEERKSAVTLWLEGLGLAHLAPVFASEGFDDVGVVQQLSDEELLKLGVAKMGERKKILLSGGPPSKSGNCLLVLSTYFFRSSIVPSGRLKVKMVNYGMRERPSHSASRCGRCCMYKVTGKNLAAHTCRTELFNTESDERHSWENCPTNNRRGHPEQVEKERLAKKAEKQRKKEEKQKAKQVLTILFFCFCS